MSTEMSTFELIWAYVLFESFADYCPQHEYSKSRQRKIDYIKSVIIMSLTLVRIRTIDLMTNYLNFVTIASIVSISGHANLTERQNKTQRKPLHSRILSEA